MKPSHAVVGVGAVAFAAAAWFGVSGTGSAPAEDPAAAGVGSAEPRTDRTGGISAREVDPARPPAVDRRLTNADHGPLLDRARHPAEVADLEDFRPLWDWGAHLGQEDAAAEEIRRCALQHERRLEGPCQWSNAFAIERSENDPEVGTLAQVRTRFDEGGDDAACREFARCELDAIVEHRTQVPLPAGTDDVIGVALSGRSSVWDPSQPADAKTYYAAVLAEMQKDLRALEQAVGASSGAVSPDSEDWNLASTARHVREYEAMLELLDE